MPQLPNVTLPKVAKYISNVGRSVKFAAIDYLGDETAPNIASFLEDNDELFKEVYSATVNYRDTIKKAKLGIKRSRIWEAGTQAWTSIKEDLKTGNWYNKEREETMGAKALGMDMDDMEFDDSMFGFDDDDFSDTAKQTRALDTSIEVAAKANAAITVQSSQLIAETVKDSTTLLYAQNEKMIGQMTAGLGSVHIAVSKVGEFLQGPVLTALQNTKTFQEETVKHQKKLEAQFDELLEMQRNLYKMPEQSKTSSTFGDVVDYEGIPDLKAYAKQVYKNFKTAMGPEFGQLFGDSFGKDSNMLMLFATSPLKAIPEMFVKMVVPMTLKQTIETFDKSLGGLFAGFIGRMNNLAKNGGFGDIFGKLGEIFGLKIEEKTTVNTANYKKGPVPFDGVTRQAIIEVIPSYLRRIEAAITGAEEKVYDFDTGRYIPIKTIEKMYKDRRKSAQDMPWWDIQQSIDEYTRKLSSKKYNVKLKDENGKSTEMKSTELAEAITKAMDNIRKKTYEDNGVFLGYRSLVDRSLGEKEVTSAANRYDVPVEVYREIMRIASDPKNRNAMMNLTNEILKSKQSLTDTMRNAEQSGYHTYNQLFNGLSDNFKADEAFDKQKKLTKGTVGFLNTMLDDKGKNIFFYLQGIYGTMLAGYNNGQIMRRTSTDEDRRGRKYQLSGNGIQGITPEEALRQAINNSNPVAQQAKDTVVEMLDENGELISVDESQNYFFEIRKKQLEEEAKKKKAEADSILGALKGGGSVGKKLSDARKVVQEYMDKPAEFVNKIIHAADMRLYELFYGKEEMLKDEEKYGRSFNGLIDRLMIRMDESFNKLDDWFKEHLFKDVENFLKESGIKNKFDYFKDFIGWGNIKDSFRNKFGIAKNSVTGAFRSVGNDIASSSMGQEVQLAALQGKLNNIGYRERIMYQQMREQADAAKQNSKVDWTDSMSSSDWSAYGDLIREEMEQNPDLTYEEAEKKVKSNLGFAAHGKYVTKRGLVMVSPGETIIPAGGKRVQKAQYAREKAFAKKLGYTGRMFAAGGAVLARDLESIEGENSPDGRAKVIDMQEWKAQHLKDEEAQKSTVRKIIEDLTPGTGYANIITSGLIGGGLSLMTGLVGGPLLGAAAGAAVSVINQSETAKSILFGKMGEDGEREGGMISKEFQQKFTKYFPDMKNYGIVGAITGLFTPLGLVGGMIAGAGVSYLKNNENVQTYLFGPADENGERDGGLISKKYREMLTKAAPRMLVGAAAGAILGPFGILPGAAMGAGIGMLTTTDQFHAFIFGEEQEDGTRKGGVVGAINEGFVEPMKEFGKKLLEDGKQFFKDKVLDPLKNFVQPVLKMVENMFTAIGDKISDAFHDKVVTPISDFVQHKLLEPFTGFVMKILKLPINAAKKVITTPFSLLQGIGNNIRGSQIAKGTADDMSAAQRVQWRNQHKGRRLFSGILGKDKFDGIDQMLASQFEGKKGLEELKGMKDALKIYIKNSKKIGSSAAKIQQELIEEISNYLNEHNMPTGEGQFPVSIYTHIGYGPVNEINKIIANTTVDSGEADLKRISKIIGGKKFKDTPFDDRGKLFNIIRGKWDALMSALEKGESELRNNESFLKSISIITKGKLKGRKDMRSLMRNIDKEIEVRTHEVATDDKSDAKLREDIANKQMIWLKKFSGRQHSELMHVLQCIAKSLDNDYKPISISSDDGNDVSDSNIINTEENDINSNPNEYTKFKPFSKLGLKAKNAKNKAVNIGKGILKSDLGIISGAAKGIGKLASTAIGSAISTPFRAIGGLFGGIKDAATGEDSYKDSFKNSADTIKSGIHSIGNLLYGPKSKINKLFKTGYSLTTDSDGNPSVINNSKNEPDDNDAAKKFKARREENNKYRKGVIGSLGDIAEGTFSLLGNLFGSAWRAGKKLAGGIFGVISQALDSTGIVGKLIGGIFGVVKVGLTLSMIGHVADFIKKTLWDPFIKPFWENHLWPAISNIGSNIYNFIKDKFPKLGEFIDDTKDKLVNFLKDPLKGATDFIVDGLTKFGDIIAKPLGDIIYNAMCRVLDRFNPFKEKSDSENTETKSTNLKDENGNQLYRDAETGELTTSSTSASGQQNEKAVKEYDVVTEHFNKGIISNNPILSKHGGIEFRKSVKYDGCDWVCEKYYDGYIVVTNTTTDESMFFGKNARKISFGIPVNNDGVAITGSVVGVIAGKTLGYIGGVALASILAAKGVAIGSVFPGIGNVIGGVIGLVVGLAIYQTTRNEYKAQVDLDIGTTDCSIAAMYFGWYGGEFDYNKWPEFPEDMNQAEKQYRTSSGQNKITDKAVAISKNTNLSSSQRYNQQIDLAKEYSEYALYVDKGGKLLYNPSSMTANNGLYLKDGTPYYGIVGSKVYKGKIFETENTAYALDLMKESDVESLESMSGSSRSGRGHAYQNAANLANQKFGNSTIGEAGCGPVAASNLINKLGGNLSVSAAARYAENGGFIDSTGGTTTDYFKSILGASGIPSAETTNKKDVYNSLKAGNPVVMLGNSGRERGTPFGSGDHYITAMGLDRNGNIIAEDPDLPDGYRKYSANRVLNDMDVGIATGMSRFKKLSARARKKSGKAISILNPAIAGATKGVSSNTIHVPGWQMRAAEACCSVESSNIGNYSAVNCNDGGTMSIGRYQFRGPRAVNILHRIINAIIANGSATESQIQSLLGNSLYTYAIGASGSEKYLASSTDKSNLKKLLDYDESPIEQNLQMCEDVNGYFKTLKSYHSSLNIKDNEDIIIFWSIVHIHNVGNGNCIRDYDIPQMKKKSSNSKNWSLDDVYNTYISYNGDSTRASNKRAEMVYNWLKNTKPIGDTAAVIARDGYQVTQAMLDYASTAAGEISSGSGAHDTNSQTNTVVSKFGEMVSNTLRKIYGPMFDALFGGNSSTSTGANGDLSGAAVAVPVNNKTNSAQEALVERMKSVYGKIRYSTSESQNVDNGVASCASTVGWAYNKTLGVKGMSSGAGYQALDPNFTTIYTKTTDDGRVPLNLLQPGDILYQEWRYDDKFKPTRPGGTANGVTAYPMSHAEMFVGGDQTISHGGPGKGPVYKTMNDYRKHHTMLVRRYTPFVLGEKPPFINPDGSQGVYDSSDEKNLTIPSSINPLSLGQGPINPSTKTGVGETIRNSTDILKNFGKTSGMGRGISGNARMSMDEIRRKSIKFSSGTVDQLNKMITGEEAESNRSYSGKSRSGRANMVSYPEKAISYDDFLNIIIGLLKIIANNSDNLTAILSLLKDKFNADINSDDIASNNKSAQNRLKESIRKSGMGRAASISKGPGSQYGGVSADSSDDLKYIVNILTDMARA